MKLVLLLLMGIGLLDAQNFPVLGETIKNQSFGLEEETHRLTEEVLNPGQATDARQKTSFRFPWQNFSKIKFRLVTKGSGVKKVTGFVLVIRLPNLRSPQIIATAYQTPRP